MVHLVFSHANSYGASTYRMLFNELGKRGFHVDALEQYGHHAHYPVINNWLNQVQELTDFIENKHPSGQKLTLPNAYIGAKQRPLRILVGHSFGGFISLMCAALNPDYADGVVLVDSPVINGWRANFIQTAKKTKQVHLFSPSRISRRRRTHWANKEEALAYFQTKKAYATWHPQVLSDFIEHGLQPSPSKNNPTQVELRFAREVESAIYDTIPHHLNTFFKKHPLLCPVAFVGGLQSVEAKRINLAYTTQLTQGRMLFVNGTHLFPMQYPLLTAAALETSILNLLHAQKIPY